MKIVISIPLSKDTGRCDPEMDAGVDSVLMAKDIPILTVLRGLSGSVFVGRERTADWIKAHSEASHLLFWDSDIVAQAADLRKLIAHKTAVVSAAYCATEFGARCEPIAYYDNGSGGLVPFMAPRGLEKVAAAGLGFCLIAREVFDRLTPPYFEHVAEDFHFFRSCRAANVQPYVDFDCWVDHVGRYRFGRRDVMAVAQAMQAAQRRIVTLNN